VEAASKIGLRYFRGALDVEWKSDLSPVTRADKESEAAIVGLIRDAFPTHTLLAEETGAHPGDPDARWLIDPLDGTRGFSRGGSFWGPLVALEHRGEIVVGAMAIPALGETYWAARGQGAFRDDVRLRVSTTRVWKEATLSLGELSRMLVSPYADGVGSLIKTCTSVRSFGDVAACAMLLNGRAEAWLESGVRPWDLAPFAVMVEEAGGRFTNFEGVSTIESGAAVATNGALHEHVLATLRGGAPG
jgi:histidinol-phosphatase